MNVCIIGNGHVGGSLAFQLSNRNFCVTVVSKSKPSNPDTRVTYITSRYENLPESLWSLFEVIILCTGQSRVARSESLMDCIYNDVVNFAHLCSNLATTQKLIYMSSSGVYGNVENEVVDESHPTVSSTYYESCKSFIDNIAAIQSRQHNKQIIGLRIGELCGPSPYATYDAGLNRMVFEATSLGVVPLQEAFQRSFVGIQDLANVISRICEQEHLSDIFNVASFSCTFHQARTQVALHCNANIHLDETGAPSTCGVILDTSRIEKRLGFSFGEKLDDVVSALHLHIHCLSSKDIPPTPSSINYFGCEMRDRCRVCNKKTRSLLDLGYQPLANGYHSRFEMLDTYPLHLHYCEWCFHSQLNCAVDRVKMIKHCISPSNTSSTARKTSADTFASTTLQRLKSLGILTAGRLRVLDIACSDGSQLDAFKTHAETCNLHIDTVGVDSAERLFPTCVDRGHDVLCCFFDEETTESLIQKWGDFDVIIAQDVFAQVDNPLELLQLCKRLCHSNTVIYIQTPHAMMIANNEFAFDHEHVSYFCTNSMKILCDKAGLYLNRIQHIDVPGTSYLFEMSLMRTHDSNVTDALYEEIEKGLYSDETYEKYKMLCLIYKNKYHSTILQYKQKGYVLYGFGSTRRSNILLNFCKVDSDIIHAIIDENPMKHGLLAPGSNIPIIDIQTFKNKLPVVKKPILIIVFASNYFDKISEKLGELFMEFDFLSQPKILNITQLQSTNC